MFKHTIALSYITLYFLNLISLMIFFFFLYNEKLEVLSSNEYNKKNLSLIMILWSMFIAGVPPFLSFLIKFFLFSSATLSGAVLYINIVLIIIINVYFFWYVYYYYSYYILLNFKICKKVKRDNFNEYMYIYSIILLQFTYVFIHHFFIF